eukprot:gene41532-51444_t
MNAKPHMNFDGSEVVMMRNSGWFPLPFKQRHNFSNKQSIGIIHARSVDWKVDDTINVLQDVNAP